MRRSEKARIARCCNATSLLNNAERGKQLTVLADLDGERRVGIQRRLHGRARVQLHVVQGVRPHAGHEVPGLEHPETRKVMNDLARPLQSGVEGLENRRLARRG